LKPENLVLKGDELLKITDFGIIKEQSTVYQPCTDYIATRWYRAPEVVLRGTNYDFKIDIFAIGCIMAEMYMLMPLFPGSSELDQIKKIVQVLGTPEDWTEGYTLAQNKGVTIPQGFQK
jgi:serine/threonine protein kinase